jgi:hypothetical protein
MIEFKLWRRLRMHPHLDDPAPDGAPVVTQEMIETGIDTLKGFYPYFYEGIEHPDLIVRTVYEAMERTRLERAQK